MNVGGEWRLMSGGMFDIAKVQIDGQILVLWVLALASYELDFSERGD